MPLLLHHLTGRDLIPVWDYFRRRVTSGLFFDVLNHRRCRLQAVNIVGRAIERYVERLIGDLPASLTLMHLPEDGTLGKLCDFVLPGDDVTILIECKRKSITQRAKTTGIREDLKRDIGPPMGEIADAVRQLVNTAAVVKSGGISGVNPGARIIGLVVTMDSFYFANLRWVHEIVAEVLAEGNPAIDITSFDFQICSLSDIEDVCRLLNATGQPFSEFLAHKVDDPEQVEWDFPSVVRNLPLASRADPSGRSGRIPIHDEAFEALMPTIYGRFRMFDEPT